MQNATFTSSIEKQHHQVLSDTYRLLSWTILFSAFTATVAYSFAPMMLSAMAAGGTLFTLLVLFAPYFFTLWMANKHHDNPKGLIWVFAMTGWLGVTITPMLYIVTQSSGFGPVFNALASTGVIFLATSALGKKFPAVLKLGNFLAMGILLVFIGVMLNVFFIGSSIGALLLGGLFTLLAAGMISWQTAAIVHGGETSHVRATITLFVMLYNIFSFMLQFFGNRE